MITPPRCAFVFAVVCLLGLAPAWATCDPPKSPTKTIAEENCEPGNPDTEWDINGAGDLSIQGFATDMSFNVGSTANFKISTDASAYTIDIYRLGYYAGMGARKVASIQPSAALPQTQPNCLTEAFSGLKGSGLSDCGNWAVSASWNIPPTATSGIYFALLTRPDTGGKSHIYFIVRDDASHSDFLFQTSDLTWQAYNPYGLGSVYGASTGTTNADQRSFKVSYNRPIVTRRLRAFDFLFHSEYPMVRWLEANGYNVSYSSGLDTARSGSHLKQHKVFLSVGHDEYWSGEQRANVEAARAAGVNLAFFSGNEVFWKTRWENSIDGTGTPYRTLVTYKETAANAKIDPSPMWTGTWRDPRFSPPSDGGRPENALTGTSFAVNGASAASIKIPADDGKMRFWRNTAVATQSSGQIVLPVGTLGFEWDIDPDNGFRPSGLFHLSTATYGESTPTSVDSIAGLVLLDYGSTYGNGTATHHLTLYRAASGALVFGAGTINWPWGLDSVHDATNLDAFPADSRMQQATVNLFADMDAQPITRQSGLVAATKSTDTSPPSSSITSPAQGTSVQAGSTVAISGAAVDSGGGVVGGVEVSTDGGTSWHPASGRDTWSYTWAPSKPGSFTLLSRAVDDSGNLETPATGIDTTVTCPCTGFNVASTPFTIDSGRGGAVELGVKFRSDTNGFITALRFYKSAGNTGTHVAHLWTSTGALVATANFTNETASGWQQVAFVSPLAITAGTAYVASYFAPQGHYSVDLDYFATSGVSNAPLYFFKDGENGGNGVFNDGAMRFPTDSFRSSNYWVDVVFTTSGGGGTAGPSVTTVAPASGATGVSSTSTVTATFSGPLDASSINGNAFRLLDASNNLVPATVAYDGNSLTATLTPTSALAFATTYTAVIKGGPDGVRNTGGNPLAADFSWSFTTSSPPVGTCPCSAWNFNSTPSISASSDANAVELGVKFRSDTNGLVTGIRFYKGSTNTGTHVGNLWTKDGVLLASATFTNETASGWQEVTFPSAVAISAGTTYVASYFAPNGHYSVDEFFFATTGLDNRALHLLKDGADGGNGVFTYNATSTFPTSTFRSTNYWVDVVFADATGGISGPSVTTVSPASGASAVSTATKVSATFSEPLDAATVTSSTFRLLDSSGSPVSASVAYDPGTFTATLTPVSALAFSKTYVAAISGGNSGVKSATGTAMGSNVTWSFTTASAPPGTCPCSAFLPSSTPSTIDSGRGGAVELGVKFRSDVNGFITGLRFYKGAANTGTHQGHLWTSSGALLASATFTNETAAGWQQVTFLSPVAVAAGTTYVASYFAPQGHYSVGLDYFLNNGVVSGPLTFLKDGIDGGNGVFDDVTPGAFPASTFRSSNYWVDVVFERNLPVSAIASVTPADGATAVSATTTVTATFGTPMDATTINGSTFLLLDQSDASVPSTVTYDAGTNKATLTPAAPLAGMTRYRAVLRGGATDPRVKSAGGQSLAADYTWSFTTANSVVSLTLSPTSTPGGASSTGTVTLTAAAPAGGAKVDLSSSDAAVATTPASVTVPEGHTSATFTISTLTVSAKTEVTISAAYNGSQTAKLTVTAGAVSSVTLDPAALIGGNSSSGTVTLSDSAPSGGTNVALSSDNTAVATVPASVTVPAGAVSANFTITTSSVSSATDVTISASLNAAAKTAILTVNPRLATTTSVGSSKNPSNLGDSVTLTATVKNATKLVTEGTVTFKDGSTILTSDVAVNGTGTASATAPDLTVGSHEITAEYNGNATYGASTGSVTQNVNKAVSATTVATSKSPAKLGESVTFTATVKSGTKLLTTGTVTFKEGTTVLSVQPIVLDDKGTASLSTSALTVGNHTITAEYSGNANYGTSSGTVAQTVDAGDTTTTLASSRNPSKYGDPVTFTATVARATQGAASPAGTVTFKNGTTPLGDPVQLTAGKASLQTSTLAAGSATITAEYSGDANFAPSSGSVPQTVEKATSVITWANPADINYGIPLGATQLNATANFAGTFAYAPAAGTVLNAGLDQILSVTFTPTDGANHASATASVKINVLKAASTITWANPADITYGTALSATQLNATANFAGTFAYAPAAGTVLNAGLDQILSVTFTPTDGANHASATASVKINVLKAASTVTWANPGDITYGTALSATQLNAKANVPGIFTYDPPTATVLHAGNAQTLSVNFTPEDKANYAASTATAKINVQQAAPIITWATPADITYGTALSATQLNAKANVPGIFTYDPPAATVLHAGNAQTLSVTFTPEDKVNYAVSTSTVKINVLQAASAITWANPGDITFGTALDGKQLNATANVAGTFVYAPPATTVLHAAANQQLSVTFTPDDKVNYTASTATVKINVLQAASTVTWTNPADITYGTALGAAQLTARANVPGTFAYTPVAGTVLHAGADQTLSVTFTPEDTVNYAASTTTVKINVLQAASTITWANPADITYGTPLRATQLSASANVPGTLVYTPAAGTVLPAGSNQTLAVTFTPDDKQNYSATTAAVKINVLQAASAITWSNPADITFGTALDEKQLNATANVPGSFVYTPGATTVLHAGNAQTLSVTFTPDDKANYSAATTTVKINVLQAATTIVWTNPADIIYGTALGAAQLNATANVPGTLVYTPPADTVLRAGIGQTLSVTFTPEDKVNYSPATTTVKINVLQAAPLVTWSTPADITYGTALGGNQLNATANVAGSFVYTPQADTVLPAGANQSLSVRFTPNDAVNYAPQTASVKINVLQAASTITWPKPADITYGTALSETQLNATANVRGNFVYSPAAGAVLQAGANQILSVTFTPDDANYSAKTASVKINVVQAQANVTWLNPADITYGTPLSATQLNATANVPGTFAYTPPSGTSLQAGAAQALSVTFTPTDNANYAPVTRSVAVNVLKATPTITWANPADITYGTALSATQLNATASPAGTLAYTPAVGTILNPGSGQTLSVSLTPTDTANYVAINKSVLINVINHAPVANNESYTTDSGVALTVPAPGVLGNDTDADRNALTAILLAGPAHGSLALNSNGSFTYTPASGFAGADSFTYKASDGKLDSNAAIVSITVRSSTSTAVTSSLNPSNFGQAVTFTATVTPATATGTLTFFDGSTPLGTAASSGGSASITTAAVNAGTRAITAVYNGDNTFAGSTSPALTQTVSKATTTSTLTVNQAQQQYSDLMTFQATLKPTVAGGQPPATGVLFKVGTQPLTKDPVPLVDVNGVLTATLPNYALLETVAGQMKPSIRSISATYTGVSPNFTVTNVTKSISITAEDARAVYTGPTSVATGSSTVSTATIPLIATIKDVSAVTGDPAWDSNPGDITLARVTFVNRATNLSIATVDVTVVPNPNNPNDKTVGTANYNWTVDIGTATSQSYNIGIVVNNYYTRNSATENATVTVSKP